MPLRRSCWSAPALVALMLTSAFAENTWQRAPWHEEAAWSSQHGGTLAIVSEDRGRLIYLGGVDGKTNVLSAPDKKDPTDKEASPNWGGHRFWLGPQSRWNWPPPKDWEFSAAAAVEIRGDLLTAREPHKNAAFPELEREYAWEGDRLRCTVRWRGEDRPSYGMHVVAIQLPAEFEVQLKPWDHVPQGLVAIKGDTPNATNPLPHPAVVADSRRAHLRTGVAVGKFGFAPQPLFVRRDIGILGVYPGPVHGIATESPDFGYLTQLWVGGASSTFCEMEQITPYLFPAADGWCGSTIYLELRTAP